MVTVGTLPGAPGAPTSPQRTAAGGLPRLQSQDDSARQGDDLWCPIPPGPAYHRPSHDRWLCPDPVITGQMAHLNNTKSDTSKYVRTPGASVGGPFTSNLRRNTAETQTAGPAQAAPARTTGPQSHTPKGSAGALDQGWGWGWGWG